MNHVITYNYSLKGRQSDRMLWSCAKHCRDTRIHIIRGPAIEDEDLPQDVDFMSEFYAEDTNGVGLITGIDAITAIHGIMDTDMVLLLDIRDVFFQWNPFPKLDPSRVNVFAENSSLYCDSEPQNREWMLKLHEGRIPEQVKKKQIVCWGVQAGPWKLLKQHLQIVRLWAKRTDTYYGQEMAMLTTLAHNSPSDYRMHSNENGPVMHCHFQKPEVRHGVWYSPTGNIPAVVHQWDRWVVDPITEKVTRSKVSNDTQGQVSA